MALLSIDRNPNRRLLRQFAGIWLPAACAVIGFAIFRRSGSLAWALAVWLPGAVLSVAGLVRPSVVKPVWIAWMTAAFPIGWAVSHIVLLVVFYLVITPIGLLLRTLKGDPMTRELDRAAVTYWRPHRQVSDTSRYFRQF